MWWWWYKRGEKGISRLLTSMGLPKIAQFIKNKVPIPTTQKLNNYRGYIIGIDASIILYQLLYAPIDNNDDDDAVQMRIIWGFFYRTLNYLQNGIFPVYVFDKA